MKISFSKMDIRSIVDISDCTTWEKISESGAAEITGAELLKLAWDKIKEIQYLGGHQTRQIRAFQEKNKQDFQYFLRVMALSEGNN